MDRNNRLRSRLLTLVTAIASVSVPVRGGEKPPASPRPPKASAPSSATAGWRAFRDPATGKLREPTPEEALALSRRDAARKSAAPIAFEVVVHPDGTKSVDLQGAFAMSVVARRNADGLISYECRPAAAPAGTRAAQRSAPPEQ